MTRAVALGAGGERAVAWEVGVLAGLADGGLDLRSATTILGTSAGALVAARLAAGLDPRGDAVIHACRRPGEPATGLRRPHSVPGIGLHVVPPLRTPEAVPPRHAPGDASAGTTRAGAPHGTPDAAGGTTFRAAASRGLGRPPAAGGAAAFAALGLAWDAMDGSLTDRRRALGAWAIAHSPGGEEAFVARIAALLPAGGWPPALRLVAIDAESGERVVFDAGSGVPLERAVAASRAVPGLLPLVTIGGRRFVDGALGSATNADLLPGDDRIVIVPLPARATNLVEALWRAALEAEVADGLVIDADEASVAAMGGDPMSGASAGIAVTAGYARGAQIRPCRAA